MAWQTDAFEVLEEIYQERNLLRYAAKQKIFLYEDRAPQSESVMRTINAILARLDGCKPSLRFTHSSDLSYDS